MGVLSSIVGATKTRPADTDPYWYGPVSMPVAAGVEVNEVTALNYSAVWAATRIICEPVACLPRQLRRNRRTGSGSDLVQRHPLAAIFKRPNPTITGFTFFEQMTQWAVNWGTGFAFIERNEAMRPVRLWPIHPSRIPRENIKRDDNGDLTFLVNSEGGPPVELADDQVFRYAGILSEDGVCGQGVISRARESIGMGIATETFGAKFFKQDAVPKVVLKMPGKLDENSTNRLIASWKNMANGGTAVLEQGGDVTQLTIPPEDAQFLGTREFNITEFARWYQVPVHRLAKLDRATHNNIEEESLTFIKQSLMTWIKKWEEELERQLLTDAERRDLFVKMNLNSLMRGDSKARAEFYEAMSAITVFSINDIRELEDLNPIGPDGDVRFVRPGFLPLEVVLNPPAPTPDDAPPPSPPDPPQNGQVADALRDRLDAMQDRLEMLRDPANEWSDDREERIQRAAVQLLRCVIQGMVAYECRVLVRNAKANDASQRFTERLDEFYAGGFRTSYAESLSRIADAFTAAGLDLRPDEVIAAHIEASLGGIVPLLDGPVSELPAAAQAVANGWTETKADSLLESVTHATT